MQTISPDKTTTKPAPKATRSKTVPNVKIERLLQENRQYLEAIYESCEKSRKYILWGRIMTLFYLVIIVAPIIIAAIYLPPYISQLFEPYKELIQTSGTGGST